MTATNDSASKVISALARVGELEGLAVGDIAPDARLFRDLGFTSLQIVDISLCLEKELGLPEFPFQAWMDTQMELGDRGFTVQSLIDYCCSLASEGRPR